MTSHPILNLISVNALSRRQLRLFYCRSKELYLRTIFRWSSILLYLSVGALRKKGNNNSQPCFHFQCCGDITPSAPHFCIGASSYSTTIISHHWRQQELPPQSKISHLYVYVKVGVDRSCHALVSQGTEITR